MDRKIKVFILGRERELPWNTRVEDVHKILGTNRWNALILINGEPAADDAYLEEGDLVAWMRITYHESPVSEDEGL